MKGVYTLARKQFTEKQMIQAVEEVRGGATVKATCRKLGITPVTFYRWKSKYEGMNEKEAKKLRDLEDENKRLREIVADLSLDNQALKEVIKKKL